MKKVRDKIVGLIDWFYKPFSRFMPLHTFRYAACGGANTTFDIFLYFISYNYILQKQMLNLEFITLSPHIAAFFMSFTITFPTGFALNKYVTFTQSEMKGRVQLFRYGIVVLGSIILNYLLLKFFVEYCNIYPTPSKIITTSLVVIFSYFSQKNFSFKTS